MYEEQCIVVRVERDTFRAYDHLNSAWSDTLESARSGLGEEIGSIELSTCKLSFDERVQISQEPDVAAVSPSMPTLLVAPIEANDVRETIPDNGIWGIDQVGASDTPFSGSGVKVALLDTGIDAAHAAFEEVKLVTRDFTNEGASDHHGHGTHCAGTIFGRTDTDPRFSVAPGVSTALIGKVLDRDGRGNTRSMCEAVLWAWQESAHIISVSLGIDFPGYVKRLVEQGFPIEIATSMGLDAFRSTNELFERLAKLIRMNNSLGRGSVIVAAAGNESLRSIDNRFVAIASPPASASGVISVGALQKSGKQNGSLTVADFSNCHADIVAPGVGIYSCHAGGGYVRLSGTSMATPHVAGIAALWAERMSFEGARYSVKAVVTMLLGNARFLETFDSHDIGAGIVQAPK